MNDWLQYSILGVIVALSAWTVFGRVFPGLRRKLLLSWGHHSPSTSSGCDAGCGSCNGCGTEPTSSQREQPIRLHR